MKCPEHKVKLDKRHTRYGYRYSCPVRGCTVVWWGLENTTPADEDTRKSRMAAHKWLDSLWKSKKYKRTVIYKMLADHLGLPVEKTHIGLFGVIECDRVIRFAEQLKD